MRTDLSTPSLPATTSDLSSSVSVVGRLLDLPERGLGFSVAPRHRGGIEARSGFDFQDQDALRQVARLLREDDRRALSVRLEGAGDTDVLAPHGDSGVVEEYRQVKGRREGRSKWTLAELRKEGVWSEFIRTATSFARRAGPDRSLLLVFVTDGEFDPTLQALRDDATSFQTGSIGSSPERDEIRGHLLLYCVLGLLTPAEEARIVTSAGLDRLRRSCVELAQILDRSWDRQASQHRVTAAWPSGAPDLIASVTSALDGDDAMLLSDAVQEAARHVDFLLESIRLESRVGRSGPAARDGSTENMPPEQAEVVLVLIEAGRLDSSSAKEAVRKLQAAVSDRSLVGATLDEPTLRRILDLPPPLQLHPLPNPVAAPIARVEIELAVLHALDTRHAAWVYGAPMVGKTEAVRATLELGNLKARTVWLRLAGDGADPERIWLHLAVWIGERTGNRELYRALRNSRPQAIEVRTQIARTGGELRAVLVVDDINLIPEEGYGPVLASLEEAHLGGISVVVVAEDRPTATGTRFGATAVPIPVEGLALDEALEFWRALGKVLPDESATLAVMQIVHRTGGHPEILRLIATELPESPTEAQLDAVRDALPAGEGAVLLRQLARKLFRSGSGGDFQRELIPRVAISTHPITEAQARAIARVDPPLRWSAFGWVELTTTLLEEVRRGLFRLPAIYQAVAQLEVADDRALARAVHRACADAVLERSSREGTLAWSDLYEATIDYVLALEWREAAVNALWLADSAPPYPAARERLQLALHPFRGPAALSCGLEPDLHVAVLGASVMAERKMGNLPGAREAMRVMGEVAAAAAGDTGYRTRAAAAFFAAGDALLAGDYPLAFAAVDPAWRETAERGDARLIRVLGDLRISAAALGVLGAGVVLEQVEALERTGEVITSLGDLGFNESTRGLMPILYARVSRTVQGEGPRQELIEEFGKHLAGFRARRLPDGVSVVAPSLAVLLYDGGQKEEALALSTQVASELAGTPNEGEGLLLLGDLHRLQEQWGAAVEVYDRAVPLLRSTGSPWLRGGHTGAALALHHHGDQRRAACHALAAYRLLAREEDASPRALYEALGRAAVLSYRAGKYRIAAVCLPQLLRLAAAAGDVKRKRLVAMLARQIAESIGAPEPRFGAVPELLKVSASELSPPAEATALGAYFFEQDLDAVGLPGGPERVSSVAHHLVLNALAAVGLDRKAIRAGKDAISEWLQIGDAAGAMLTFDLLRYVEVRAGDVAGALSRVWEVLPVATEIALQEGRGRNYAEQVVLDYWTPAPLSRLAGLAREDAERLLNAFVSHFDILTRRSRKEWDAETAIARARLALAKGDRKSADDALLAASEVGAGTRIAERVRLHSARLRAFGNGAGYPKDVMEALRLQVEYAEHLAAAGGAAESERAELGRRQRSFWTETVNSKHPPFDALARLFAREGESAPGFRRAAADLFAALDLIDVPDSIGADLAGRLLDDGAIELDEDQVRRVLRRYVAAGLERAMAAGRIGGIRFAQQEYTAITKRLRTHWATFEPSLRQLFPPPVLALLQQPERE